MADAAARADPADDRKDDVLRRDVGGELAVDRDGHPLRAALRERLGGEHVLDLDVPMPNASAPNAPWVAV
ncbi:MAG: hypothetical protein WKF58_03825 [Ilumatobacteraceae bacterium]